ncbi:helix-turn-helix domain-containing protein [Paenibacillus sp. J2TS4]|uniref:helix-turn-helix domain-containing protein n=1 Tax=Paenibacillus sp. J2TS4 TaxID=2807194 RepID=UPI0020C0D038|nr:helix-turn-helix domain-containing protein [Paenibacillus sp. J2TS4]
MKGSKLFWRYFLYYILTLMIPLSILGGIIFHNVTNMLMDDIIETNQNMLRQVREIVDTRLDEIGNISFQISSNPNLAPHMLRSSAYREMQGKYELKNYMSSTSFINDILLYIRGEDIIYSPYSTYTVSRLMQTKYNYLNWTTDELYETLNTLTIPEIRPKEDVLIQTGNTTVDEYGMISFLVPIPVYSNYSYGTLLFQVRESTLVELIQDVLSQYQGSSIILDRKGREIASLQRNEMTDIEDIARFAMSHPKGNSEIVRLNGHELLISVVTSDKFGWSYVTWVPTVKIMKEVRQNQLSALIGLIVVLVLGCCLTFYFSLRLYNPIRQLKEYAETKSGKRAGNINEIEIVRQVITSVADEKTNLIRQMENSRHALKDYLLFKVIKGHIYDLEQFNAIGKNLNITFTNPYFMVAILFFHQVEKQVPFHSEQIISLLENGIFGQFEGYAKESMDSNAVVLLLATESDNTEFIKQRFMLLKEWIHTTMQLTVTIGIGRCYREMAKIGKSYMESLTAIQYRFVLGNNRLILFSEIDNKEFQVTDYPEELLDGLKAAIKREDIEAIGEIMQRLVSKIQQHRSLFMARSLSYDVINTIIKTVVELNETQLIDIENLPDVITLMELETVQELDQEVSKICQTICDSIRRKEENQSELMRSILEYLHQMIFQPTFSVAVVADSIGISPSYLSRYFKEQTGMTITDYVNMLRLKETEKLLKESDVSIQEIVQKIGYYDVSSFIRKFKSKTGLTPGEYRKLYKI